MAALPVLSGDEAMSIVKQLAERNPGLSGVIEDLGKEVLRLPGVGLRNGLDGKTYDVAFVRSNPKLAFATFKAPSFFGTWQSAKQKADQLTVEVRFRGVPTAPGSHDWLNEQQPGGKGWYFGHVNEDGSGIRTAIESITEAYRSWIGSSRASRDSMRISQPPSSQ